jgi:hypothetical protein
MGVLWEIDMDPEPISGSALISRTTSGSWPLGQAPRACSRGRAKRAGSVIKDANRPTIPGRVCTAAQKQVAVLPTVARRPFSP